MAKHRWIWWQHHGTHLPTSPEAILHAQGRPFLAGRHCLDDPAWQAERQRRSAGLALEHCFGLRARKARKAAAQMRSAQPIRYVTRETLTPPPAAGRYEHLSWLYFNLGQKTMPSPPWPNLADALLTADPEVLLLLYFRFGHPACVELVDHLQARWPDRFVLAYHKTNCLCQTDQGGAGAPHENNLWARAHIRLLSPRARCCPGWPAFRDANRNHLGDVIWQSSVMDADDLVGLIELAEQTLVAAPFA